MYTKNMFLWEGANTKGISHGYNLSARKHHVLLLQDFSLQRHPAMAVSIRDLFDLCYFTQHSCRNRLQYSETRHELQCSGGRREKEATYWTINMWKLYQTVCVNDKFTLSLQRAEAHSSCKETVTTLADGINGIIIFQPPSNYQK